MNEKINFLALYEQILKTLPSKDIQTLMDKCHALVGVPILAVDIMYNLLGASPQKKTGDYYWDLLLEQKGYDTDTAIHLYESGIMQSVNYRKAPYIVDWGDVTEQFLKIQGVVRVNDTVVGYVTMQCSRSEITDERIKAMEIIQEALSIFMLDMENESAGSSSYGQLFIGELLNDRIHSESRLDLWKKSMQGLPNPPYRIAAISVKDEGAVNVLSYICRTVLHFFSCQLTLVQDDILYILQYNLNLIVHADELERRFNEILVRFDASCGLSRTFDNLLDVTSHKLQARDAMTYGESTGKKYRIYYYDDMYLASILLPRMRDMPEENLISPAIPLIRAYDAEHGTDYLETLRVYVKNLCNPALSADGLHIHRNTLSYRIAKAEEIGHISVKDYETFLHLMISFYALGK